MPSDEEVKAAADKIIGSGKAIAKEYGHEISHTYPDRGNPAEKIVSCAENCDADLIVTGRRGLGNLGSLVLGSTSHEVNHKAKCACLSAA